ncbi:MAG: hypothetical protein KGK17_09730 [Betaproteobacteria bacterium]|nr:hypothetical protein [Betaproteobacteria bacterium]
MIRNPRAAPWQDELSGNAPVPVDLKDATRLEACRGCILEMLPIHHHVINNLHNLPRKQIRFT